MAPRVNEDERNERIIRGLLKLPGNRRCINCNSLGPQYVCTNFWTFVCTTCSGIHREFTHRVKSVSMAKFTSQEVSTLQGGGNEHAKEVYFKEWDSQRQSVPDNSNIERLRDFIRHVYVDRRYTGERSIDRPPRVKMVDREDSYTYRSNSHAPPYEDTYECRYIEKSTPGGRKNERNSRYNYDERSPRYDHESQKYGDSRRSPAQFEVVDHRIQDDRSGNRKSEDNRFSDGKPKPEGRSPNYQKELDMSRPQVILPVRDILGDHFPTLRVGEPPRANGGRAADGSDHTQRTVSLRSTGSIDGKLMELRRANSGSLTFFNADLEPAPQTQASTSNGQSIKEPTNSSIIDNKWATFAHPTQEKVYQAVSLRSTGYIDGKLMELRRAKSGSLTFFKADLEPAPRTQQASTSNGQPIREPTNSSIIDNTWATFAHPTQEKVSQAASNAKITDSVLPRLSVPASTPVGNMSVLPVTGGVLNGNIDNMPMLPVSFVCATAPVSNMSVSLPSGSAPGPGPAPATAPAPAAAPSGTASSLPIRRGNSLIEVNDAGEWPSMQQPQHSSFPNSGSHSSPQQFTPSVGGSNNQSWSTSLVPNSQGSLSTPNLQSSQSVSKQTHEIGPAVVSQSLLSEKKSTGSKELPEDLFTAAYSSVPAQVPRWQAVQHFGMGYGMQYPSVAHVPAFPQPSKSTNPFDLNKKLTPVQVPMFPSMASLQGALPNVTAPTGLLCTSSLGAPSPQWMTPWSSPYPAAMPPQPVSYISGMPPSAYMGQQIPSNLPPPAGPQGVGVFGSDGALSGTLNTSQQLGDRLSTLATPSSFSSTGGNPFG